MPAITPVISLSLALLVSASPLLSYRADITTHCDAKDFCSGVNSTISLPGQYICGDNRLGPVDLEKNKAGMKGELGDVLDNYDPFRRACPGAFLQTFGNGKGWFNYPDKNGFEPDSHGNPIKKNVTLEPGTKLDRFGHDNGTFLAPYGLPYEQRSLVPANLATDPTRSDGTVYNYHVYEVIKALPVQAGPIASFYDQPGNGTQYLLSIPVWAAVRDGYLVEICKPATYACGNRPGTNIPTWMICNTSRRREIGGEYAAGQHCKLHQTNQAPFCQAERL